MRWHLVNEPVVVDGNLDSSRTRATSAPFAKAMVDFLQPTPDEQSRMPDRRHAEATKPRCWLWIIVPTLGLSCSHSPAASLDENYNQWKQALNTITATAAEHVTALPASGRT